jgi:hypothetical protein
VLEAYRIGISIALTNRVGSVLGAVARDFSKADARAWKKPLVTRLALDVVKAMNAAEASISPDDLGFPGMTYQSVSEPRNGRLYLRRVKL